MKFASELYGCDVFDLSTMKSQLSSATFSKLEETIKDGSKLDESIANEVASAMKNWAIEKGATHYTHWFQPLTGITAEKHDGFISYNGEGNGLMEFSGKALIQGEPDASSFPSGGLRSTFEARGYTAWDPTSYAFIKDKTLCIPTAFCSYGGEALDKKTPLLRSMDALNKQSLRILRLLGNSEVKKVTPMVGPEQEYFLIDKDLYSRRKDLIYTGRTLFGSLPPKGQELEDHYFGSIKPKVQNFMNDLNEQLWKLGIPAKTEHNEVAPGQHELAPIYESSNIATDHNQLTMEMMQKVAEKHDMVCLFHEKPFDGVNGSGKHNNWSITTDSGINLLSPGKTPSENEQFLLFLTAVLKAVDDYQDLIRVGVASAGNDHRLGASEAPPAIVSVYLGSELAEVLEAIKEDTAYESVQRTYMKLGVRSLPTFQRDTTDRNRTSPVAFTGNKFEFRMLGSSDSTACLNVMLNSAVADTLRIFADELEGEKDIKKGLHELIRREVKAHERIVFNGNGYDESWVEEAERRGLLNLKTTPDCIPYLIAEKNIAMLTGLKVYSESELRSRYAIQMENYCKTIMIEAKTMSSLIMKSFLPSIDRYIDSLCDAAGKRKEILGEKEFSYEKDLIKKLSELNEQMYKGTGELDQMIEDVDGVDIEKDAKLIKTAVLDKMTELRKACDQAEKLCAKEYWPMPDYGDLLFSID
ncbi:MAG: glutamine synthetase III [Erysipelotrichaceae bacterium]|nr:glutamine synthetase III [Erysipelotrichaceae bacterium]